MRDLQVIRLSENCFACGQIETGDIEAFVAGGIRSIVNNRPDGEQWGQPASGEIEAAATRHGLGYAYVPVYPGGITAENVEALRQALLTLPGPVLLYCRSGARSTMLWQLAGAE